MKRKYAFIFLGLGLLLFASFILYRYTNLFGNNSPENDDSKTIINDNNYDYVKSSNTSEKTRVFFPIFNDLIFDDYNSDDFNKSYFTGEKIYYSAFISKTTLPLEEYVLLQNYYLKKIYEDRGYNVSIDSIVCNNTCYRYKVSNNDNTIIADEITLFIKISSNEIFYLSYHIDESEISQNIIDTIINGIKITNDASYTISKIINGKINIELKMYNNKFVSLKLDGGTYEEEVNGDNGIRYTNLKNIKTGETLRVLCLLKKGNVNISDFVDNYFGYNSSSANKTDITNSNMKTYEYEFNGKKNYAIILNSDAALLLIANKGIINISDFSNITVKDV